MARFGRSVPTIGWGILAGLASVAAAAPPLSSVRVASNLTFPLFVTHAPNDFERTFIIEQCGLIKILSGGSVASTPFLDIRSRVSCGGERGLLGLAFHPDYATNGYFFVDYTDLSGTTIIARYTVSSDPDVALTTEERLLTVAQPFANHNGGWMAFGPTGYLYIAMGDGGSFEKDPGNRAQTLSGQLLGKILRIDVNGDDFPADANRNYAIPPTNPFVGTLADDEIWAYGLRNPWRNSFDRLTNDLYIADVGALQMEEIDFQPVSSNGGENYGWRCMEGMVCTGLSGCTCNSPSLVLPIHTYMHTGGNCSITGGYVYRGCAIPGLQGTYFFADYCSAKIWSFRNEDGIVTEFTDRTQELKPSTGTISSIASFGEDAFGELYVCDLGGRVYKIVPANAPPDCNNNNLADGCDIATGASLDENQDGVPDDCVAPPPAPTPDTTGLSKSRAISFGIPQSEVAGVGLPAAFRVTLTSLHHPNPPYTGGISADYSSFEGQVRWVGPPATYIESASNPIPFQAAMLQCTPFYMDWSTVGSLHVIGTEIVPSSVYEVARLGGACDGNESNCGLVSASLEVRTTRWGDVDAPFNPPETSSQPDFSDLSALVNKFKSAIGAPIKVRAALAGDVPDLLPDIGFTHISACVDAFKGFAFPFGGPVACP